MSPITELVHKTLDKVGMQVAPSKRRLSRQMLTNMNIAQLQIIINEFHTYIETLNEQLVKYLMDRDDLSMKQDSMLIDVEDITRYLWVWIRRRLFNAAYHYCNGSCGKWWNLKITYHFLKLLYKIKQWNYIFITFCYNFVERKKRKPNWTMAIMSHQNSNHHNNSNKSPSYLNRPSSSTAWPQIGVLLLLLSHHSALLPTRSHSWWMETAVVLW